MDRDDALRDLTHKGDGTPVAYRVLDVLLFDKTRTKPNPLATLYTARLVALLVEKMVHRGEINEAQLDDLLLRTIDELD